MPSSHPRSARAPRCLTQGSPSNPWTRAREGSGRQQAAAGWQARAGRLPEFPEEEQGHKSFIRDRHGYGPRSDGDAHR
jgi:hypothetical protein